MPRSSITAARLAVQAVALRYFEFDSSADSATLIANSGSGGGGGGTIFFLHESTGGTACVEVFGNGNLDISVHDAPGVTIGSLEGTACFPRQK